VKVSISYSDFSTWASAQGWLLLTKGIIGRVEALPSRGWPYIPAPTVVLPKKQDYLLPTGVFKTITIDKTDTVIDIT
jgi:hypothetical protein